ncbi:unnamed protein product [Gordionus sp. m RMFG-2023]
MMCIDTYIAIKYPFFYRNKYAHTDKTIRIIVLAFAFFSILVVLPFLFYFDILSHSPLNLPIPIDRNHTFRLNHTTVPIWPLKVKHNYFIRFNKDIDFFSKIYDPIDVVLHVTPCLVIFVINGFTIRSFIVLEQKTLAKIASGIGRAARNSEHITHISENVSDLITGSMEENI